MSDPILGFNGEFEFMSNFVPCRVTYEGRVYPSTEHAYQAAKSLLDSDRAMIQLAKTAGQSKKLGNLVVLRPDWDEVKEQVMMELLIQKFSQPKFMELLLATGDRYLEETNWWKDRYWGVCEGRGLNRLGHLLMKIRTILQDINAHSKLDSNPPLQ